MRKFFIFGYGLFQFSLWGAMGDTLSGNSPSVNIILVLGFTAIAFLLIVIGLTIEEKIDELKK